MFLFRKFKDLPEIVGLFYVKIELAYYECSDKCEKAQESINKYVISGLMLGIFPNTIIL